MAGGTVIGMKACAAKRLHHDGHRVTGYVIEVVYWHLHSTKGWRRGDRKHHYLPPKEWHKAPRYAEYWIPDPNRPIKLRLFPEIKPVAGREYVHAWQARERELAEASNAEL